MNRISNGASGAKATQSRLPPKQASNGLKRGIAGLHAKPQTTTQPIRVPKKSYNLNNLGPEAYPDGQMPSSFVTGGDGGGGDGLE